MRVHPAKLFRTPHGTGLNVQMENPEAECWSSLCAARSYNRFLKVMSCGTCIIIIISFKYHLYIIYIYVYHLYIIYISFIYHLYIIYNHYYFGCERSSLRKLIFPSKSSIRERIVIYLVKNAIGSQNQLSSLETLWAKQVKYQITKSPGQFPAAHGPSCSKFGCARNLGQACPH